jgi:hypothetical protein
MADLQPEIPKKVQHILDNTERLWGRVFGRQKQQVDVAEWRQHPSTVPAGRRDAKGLDALEVGFGGGVFK